jgi:hypothetical protein
MIIGFGASRISLGFWGKQETLGVGVQGLGPAGPAGQGKLPGKGVRNAPTAGVFIKVSLTVPLL